MNGPGLPIKHTGLLRADVMLNDGGKSWLCHRVFLDEIIQLLKRRALETLVLIIKLKGTFLSPTMERYLAVYPV